MDNQMELLETIVPELVENFLQRYEILQAVGLLAPVGRRVLAERVHLTERVLRSETDALRKQELITSSKAGMTLTALGRSVLSGLEPLSNQLLGVTNQEQALARKLGIEKCFIVRGNTDDQIQVSRQLGVVLNDSLAKLLPEGNNTIVAMGGSTMAAVAEELTTKLSKKRSLTFVPGRGGVGMSVSKQANSVCSTMARRTGGKSLSLYIPEQLSEDTYHPLINEPSIKSVLDVIHEAKIAIHGIGRADVMARRRGLDEQQVQIIQHSDVVGEAFGCFYDNNGNIIYRVPRIGLQIEDVQTFNHVFAIASGASKADAIQAYMKLAPHQTVLITDEAAAKVILKE